MSLVAAGFSFALGKDEVEYDFFAVMAYWVRMGSSGSETIIQKLRDCQDLMGHCFHIVPRIFLIFSPLARV